ncbi:MAG: hypothetical protein GIW95_12575 [Candidatus Eremiobacteraeota bacterium]|nr:hypothetical protein [Candidatus Eremiobacteraeota bacterium]
MTLRSFASALALTGTLCLTGAVAIAQIAPDDTGAGTQLGMLEQSNSGQVGDVTLFRRGNNTLVVIDLKGTPSGSREPAHIHRGKSITCDDIDPKPMFGLADVVNGKSRTLVHYSEDKLLSGNYSVNVHKSASNIKHYVSCGHLYH